MFGLSEKEENDNEEVPRYNLRQAEEKLLRMNGEPDATFYHDNEILFRKALQRPSDVYAQDVFVEDFEFELKKGKGNPNLEALANDVAQAGIKQLLRRYSAPKVNSKLILHLYLLELSDGNREARIMTPDSGIGLVRLSIGWLLARRDGSLVLDGGRIGRVDSHWMGVKDLFHLADPRQTLIEMSKEICSTILQQSNIPMRRHQSSVFCS